MKWLALVGLAGCAQLFGIDPTTGANDAPPMTAGAVAEVQRVSVGATVLTAPEDLTLGSDTLEFLVPDAAGTGGYDHVAATQGPTGTWTAPIAAGNPLVDFTLNGARHIWAFPTRDLKIGDVRLEHPDATPADPASSLAVSVSLPTAVAAGESFEILEVGPWLSAALDATDPLSQVVMTTSMTQLSGATSLAALTPADKIFALRYLSGAALTGVFEADGFAETAGANTVSGTMAAVTGDQSFGATIDPTTQATRFAAVRPAVGTPLFSWSVFASPGAMQGTTTGPLLASGAVAMADTAIAAMYSGAFASFGWSPLFDYAASESRSVTVNGLTLELSTSSTSLVIPDASNPTLDLPGAIAQTISLDTTPLSTDNTTVTIDRTMPATIQIVVDRPGSIMTRATLYQVVPNDVTTATLSYVLDVLSNDPTTLAIPSDALVAGMTYTIAITCYAAGYTGAATGDLQTTSPPFHYATTYSGVFTVNP